MSRRTLNKFLPCGLNQFNSHSSIRQKLLRQTFQNNQSQVTIHCYSNVAPQSKADDSQNWVKSPFPDVQPVEVTVPEFLWPKVLEWGNAPAYECGVTGRKYSFAQLYRNSRGFSAGLMKAGCQRGHVLGLVIPNVPEFPIALLGSWDAGLIVSTINPGYTSHEISRQLQNSESKYVVTVHQFLPAVLKAKESCPNLEKIIIIDFDAQAPEGCLSFFDMMKTDPKGFDFLKSSEINVSTAPAFLPYSSGTSGLPKGVKLTHQNLATNVRQHVQPGILTTTSLAEGQERQERLIGILPFFHISGLHRFNLTAVHQGAHTMTLPKFEPSIFVKAIKSHRPTLLNLVPPLINFIIGSPDIGQEELASVHTISAGTAPIGQARINNVLEKAGKYIFFQEAYGLTETSPMVLMLSPRMKHTKIGSTGTPVPSTICKIIDVETGRSLGSNQRGELCIKGPQVTTEYFKNEKATADTIDPDGWFHTGDIAYFDDDKHFYIVDRLKELIKVKGFQVAPSELEDLLRQHENVSDAAVIGIADEKSGELPRAYIVPKRKGLGAEEINDFIKDKVIAYKQLKGGIQFVDTIPKAPSGKVLRRELLAQYKKEAGL